MFEQRVGSGRIFSWTTLIVLFWVLFAATQSFAEGENLALRPSSSATVADRPAANPPEFRLGDAARPFGWSTVVSDFNQDGIPDLAIANRAPRSHSEFRYDIEVAVAGRKPFDVTFTSPLQALTLQSNDVDGDLDIDIVVIDPISNDVVGVWLNDGEGHFAAGDPRGFARHSLRCLLESWQCSTEGIPASLSGGQNQPTWSRRFHAYAVLIIREAIPRLEESFSLIDRSSSANPRAPPFSYPF